MKTTIQWATLVTMLMVSASAASAAIVQDNLYYVAFEAEIGTIDNSGGSPDAGWVVNGVTTGNMPADPSGESYVVNTDNSTADAPNDILSFELSLITTGNYTGWFRIAYTDQDYEQSSDASNVNDSFFYQNGTDAQDWRRDDNSPKLDAWQWVKGDGGDDDINFASTGPRTWQISSREDGLIMDRIVLISENNNDNVDAAYLDGLANSIPEPGTLALLGLGGLAALVRRRRA